MEPTDLPEPDVRDGDAETSVRKISLTPASAHTAARSEEAESGFSDRSKGYLFLVTMGAIFVSVLWPASIFAFMTALLGLRGLIDLGPEWWILIAAGALFPIPVIWLAVITWNKSRDLSNEARRLALVADRLLEPDQAAAHEIATIGLAIRREVDTLAGGVEVALDKVRSLEGAVAAQAIAIEEAAAGAEARAEQVRLRMEKERLALKEVATGLESLTKTHAEDIERHAGSMEDVASRARLALDETTRHLDRQGQVLAQAVSTAVSDSQRVALSIEEQVGQLNRASDNALAITDALSDRYEAHIARIEGAASRLGEEQGKLETVLAKERELLTGISELITNQNGQILNAIDGGVSHLDEALRRTVSAARTAADGLNSDIAAMSGDAQETLANITRAAEKASSLAGGAQDLLDAEVTRMRKILEGQSALARETMNALFAEFETLFQSKSSELSGQSAQEVAALRKDIDVLRESASAALREQADEARSLVQEAGAVVKETSANLSAMFDKVVTAGEKSGSLFTDTSARVEQHMKALPGLAEETSERIRQVLDEELNAFAALAEDSSRKIRTLHEAYARHLPGVPKPASAFQGVGGGNPSSLSLQLSQRKPGEDPASGKGDWAWGDVLKAADRPFSEPKAATSSTPQASGGTPSSAAQAFSKSSLQIFETLQTMSVDIDRAIESEPPRDLLRRYLNGEKDAFTARLATISNGETATRIHDRYLEDAAFRHNVNQYIDQFEHLLQEATATGSEDMLIETFMSSNTGRVYFLLGSAIGHFG